MCNPLKTVSQWLYRLLVECFGTNAACTTKAYPHTSVSAARHVIDSGMLTVARGLRRGIFDKLECDFMSLSEECTATAYRGTCRA